MHKAKNIYFLLINKNEMAQGRVPSPMVLNFLNLFTLLNTEPK